MMNARDTQVEVQTKKTEGGVSMFNEKNEVAGVIYKTNDYDLFKLIYSNREVKASGRLEATAKKFGFYSPIVVNEKFEVIDGQHRLAVSKDLGLPVEYIVRPGLSIQDIISMNSSAKNWSLEDYIRAYATSGYENFVILQEVKKSFPEIPYSYYIDLAYTNSTGHNNIANKGTVKSRARIAVLNGEFEFYNLKNFTEYLAYYTNLITSNGLKNSKNTFVSLYRIWALEEFDENRLNEKLIPMKQKISMISGAQSALLTFLEVYNSNLPENSKKRINHSFDYKLNVILHGTKRDVEDNRTLSKKTKKGQTK